MESACRHVCIDEASDAAMTPSPYYGGPLATLLCGDCHKPQGDETNGARGKFSAEEIV